MWGVVSRHGPWELYTHSSGTTSSKKDKEKDTTRTSWSPRAPIFPANAFYTRKFDWPLHFKLPRRYSHRFDLLPPPANTPLPCLSHLDSPPWPLKRPKECGENQKCAMRSRVASEMQEEKAQRKAKPTQTRTRTHPSTNTLLTLKKAFGDDFSLVGVPPFVCAKPVGSPVLNYSLCCFCAYVSR